MAWIRNKWIRGGQEGNGDRGVLGQYSILSSIIRSLRKYLSKDLKE